MIRWGGIVPVSLVDYPGHVAVTLFTAGCNLRCGYCHNPDLVLPPLPKPAFQSPEILKFLTERQGRVRHVVITGGEPTLQAGMLEFLNQVRGLGYRIKLDTNGTRPRILAGWLKTGLIDYVAMDVKTNPVRYGVLGYKGRAEIIWQSTEIIRELAPDYEFRTTVVPGIVEEEDVLAIATRLAGARRYVLQQFVPSSRLLDPSLMGLKPYSGQDLKMWAAKVSPYFQEPVQVRNLGRGISVPR